MPKKVRVPVKLADGNSYTSGVGPLCVELTLLTAAEIAEERRLIGQQAPILGIDDDSLLLSTTHRRMVGAEEAEAPATLTIGGREWPSHTKFRAIVNIGTPQCPHLDQQEYTIRDIVAAVEAARARRK